MIIMEQLLLDHGDILEPEKRSRRDCIGILNNRKGKAHKAKTLKMNQNIIVDRELGPVPEVNRDLPTSVPELRNVGTEQHQQRMNANAVLSVELGRESATSSQSSEQSNQRYAKEEQEEALDLVVEEGVQFSEASVDSQEDCVLTGTSSSASALPSPLLTAALAQPSSDGPRPGKQSSRLGGMAVWVESAPSEYILPHAPPLAAAAAAAADQRPGAANPTNSATPALKDWPGVHEFTVSINLSEPERQAVYYAAAKKLYVNTMINVPFTFCVREGTDTQNLQISALPVFPEMPCVTTPVRRCPSHRELTHEFNVNPRTGTTFRHVQHVLRADHEQARYISTGDRHSVVVPLEPPPPGERGSIVFFKFCCMNTCVGGINRRRLSVLFTLQDRRSGEALACAVIEIKVCKCPHRDFRNDLKRASDGSGGPSSGKRREKGSGHFLLDCGSAAMYLYLREMRDSLRCHLGSLAEEAANDRPTAHRWPHQSEQATDPLSEADPLSVADPLSATNSPHQQQSEHSADSRSAAGSPHRLQSEPSEEDLSAPRADERLMAVLGAEERRVVAPRAEGRAVAAPHADERSVAMLRVRERRVPMLRVGERHVAVPRAKRRVLAGPAGAGAGADGRRHGRPQSYVDGIKLELI